MTTAVQPLESSLPRAIAAESAIIGAVLIDAARVLPRVSPIVTSRDFAKEAHRLIFEAMQIVFDDAGSVDGITLRGWLRDRGELESVGGWSYVSSCMDPTPDMTAVEGYAVAVRDASRRRSLIANLARAMNRANDGGDALEVIVADMEAQIAGIGTATDRATRPIEDVVSEVIARADDRAKRGDLLGVRTGYRFIDELMNGLQRQALTVIAAPSSTGKTGLALNIATAAVERSEDVRGAIYSLEMSEDAVGNRLLARGAHVPLDRIRQWKLDAFEREAIATYQVSLRDLRRRLLFTSKISSIDDIIADATKRKATGGLDFMIVDYLQLVKGADDETREREVNRVAWQLTELAKRLDVAVIALSQVTSSDRGRMTIESLRESKAIGHHARSVLILDRPRQAKKDDKSVPWCLARIQIEKQSEGVCGDVVLHFDGRYQMFTEGGCPNGCPYGNGLREEERYN